LAKTTTFQPFRCEPPQAHNRLGGDDWDERVVDRLVKKFKETTGVDVSKDKIALQATKKKPPSRPKKSYRKPPKPAFSCHTFRSPKMAQPTSTKP
jgi:molecular chaperone DnaK